MKPLRPLVCTFALTVAPACVLAILVPPAVASPSQDSNFELEGPITKQSAGTLTIDQGQGIFFRVAYDEKTPITKDDGSSASAKDLKIGVRVHVVGDLQDSGEIKASRIEIETKQEQPDKKPSGPQP